MVPPLPHDHFRDRIRKWSRWCWLRLLLWVLCSLLLLAAAWYGLAARRSTGGFAGDEAAYLSAITPIALEYALIVALFPYGRSKLLAGCVLGAAVIGFVLPDLPEIPISLPIVSFDGVLDWLRNNPILAAATGMVILFRIGRVIEIIAVRRTPTSPIPQWAGVLARTLAIAVVLAILLVTLWTVAELRRAVTSSGASGMQLQAAYLPHLLMISLIICFSLPGNSQSLFRMTLPIVTILGLWPCLLPTSWSGVFPWLVNQGDVWVGILIYVPASIVGVLFVRYLLRWPWI